MDMERTGCVGVAVKVREGAETDVNKLRKSCCWGRKLHGSFRCGASNKLMEQFSHKIN